MLVKPCSLNIDVNNHEIDNRGTPMFPCGGYTTIVSNTMSQSIPWHWHNEVEVLSVRSGILTLKIVGECHQIKEGESAFINTGVLQSATTEGINCEIQSLVFHPSIISGITESIVEQRYVRPLLNCIGIPCLHFGKSVLWHREASRYILDSFAAYKMESFGYELLVREKLSYLWYLIVSNHQELLNKHAAIHPDALRIKYMLAYIHTNYAYQITLSDIAKAASIGERECLRCFKRTTGVTPMKYLSRHRISVAAGLLSKTDMNVTEICLQSGSESSSYFSYMFKKVIGTTPKEYRQLLIYKNEDDAK